MSIRIDVMGGLGNQLFQIFAAIHVALQHDYTFAFLKDKQHEEHPPRPTYWDTILIDLQPYLVSDFGDNSETVVYRQNDRAGYTPISIDAPDVHLKGYFQNYRYFSANYLRILSITGLLTRRQEVARKVHFSQTPTISMHFRRGDYCHLRCYHTLLSKYYYRYAVNRMREILGVPFEVVCFYEEGDREAVLGMVEYLRQEDVTFIMDHEVNRLSDWEQMLAMSLCDHHIIANSTFSWWGAYLNPRKEKVVCYPDAWFGHQLWYLDVDGYRLPEWHKINARNPEEKMCDCIL